MTPEEISANLSLKPEISWMVGTQRKTPQGRLLEGYYESTYWCFNLEENQYIGLAEALETFTNNLEAYKNLFIHIRSTGGRIEYFIGWFADLNSGEIFNYQFLSKLADLQIDISLDIYSSNADFPAPCGTADGVEVIDVDLYFLPDDQPMT
ncbi:MAG TPA: hypothetical protein DDZ80_17965 [Cyanobacteria bacterium UBA8803]|nr:hypothetical protein [Cyanobacteria bacterium UBA9273]HBL60272.1 hypothetical protein [Cyanobacteria bacterium UBA8803]